MCKTCWASVVLLLGLTAGMAYMFIIKGSVTTDVDGRTAIILKEGERDLVLSEMRAFLAAVQQITAGLSSGNMKMVAESAREVGLAAQQAVPVGLMGKLPIEFKKLGFDTHSRFDALALNAEEFGDTETALTELGTLMQNCVGCHGGYKLVATPD